MFTGLIEQVGVLQRREIIADAGKIYIQAARLFESPVFGESVAVNGVCLTLEEWTADGTMRFHAMAETFKRTNLGELPLGSAMNLERAMRLGDRFGGHIVSGHVDAAAAVLGLAKVGGDYELKLAMPQNFAPFVVEKGSVAVDGVSLTVVEVNAEYFTVHLIPVTLQETALKQRERGSRVNLESDLLGKYVVRQLELAGQIRSADQAGSVTMDKLLAAGFLD